VPGDAFLAGLLQDIGVQVVLRVERDCYRSLRGDCSHDDLLVAELDRIETDHAAVGAALLEAWHLPDKFVEAVGASHDDALTPADPPLARLVAVAGTMADGINGDADALLRAMDRRRHCSASKTNRSAVRSTPSSNPSPTSPRSWTPNCPTRP